MRTDGLRTNQQQAEIQELLERCAEQCRQEQAEKGRVSELNRQTYTMAKRLWERR